MKRIIRTSLDGSHTIYNEDIDESYHSEFGAITESLHIFLQNGYRQSISIPINILEIGFGTGLNALLTQVEAERTKRETYYETVELYPVDIQLIEKLNFPEQIGTGTNEMFLKMHQSEWGKPIEYSRYFSMLKIKGSALEFEPSRSFDVVYFDAFSPDKQPELWTLDFFQRIYAKMNVGGTLLTYCAKGIVKRALREANFRVEVLPGPPGKRHIIRATK